MIPDNDHRAIPGFPGFRVEPDGTVWSVRIKRVRTLPPRPGEKGEGVYIQRPDGRWVRVSIRTIKRTTFGGPSRDDLAFSPAARGIENGRACMTEADVRESKELRAIGWTYPKLAAHFGVSRSTVFNILAGRTWAHTVEPRTIRRRRSGRPPEEDL